MTTKKKTKPSNGKNKRIVQLEERLAHEQNYTTNLERELATERKENLALREERVDLRREYNKRIDELNRGKFTEMAMRLKCVALLSGNEGDE